MQPHFMRAVLLEALAGTALGIFLGLIGGFFLPWLAQNVGEGPGDPYLMASSVLGVLGGFVLGAAGGIYTMGQALGQTGAWWSTLLGSLLGAVLVAVPMNMIVVQLNAELPFLTMSGLVGGGTLLLALVGYHRTW